MSRSAEIVARRWSIPEARARNDGSTSGESSSPAYSIEYSPNIENTSTPLRSRWSDAGRINRSRRGQGRSKDLDEVSSNERRPKRLRRHKERISRGKYQDDGDRITERQRRGYDRREKRRSASSSEETDNEGEKQTSGLELVEVPRGDSDAERKKRKKRDSRDDHELPITEILKKSQENARTKYEHQSPLPVLTTDKIYVQHRGGFSAVKINQRGGSLGERKAVADEALDVHESQNSPPIRVAIVLQQFWKRTGILFQGLLAGMALMHFIVLHVFFNPSIQFVSRYSMLSEIYTTCFSFLIAMSILSTFDKFDLARFDVEHLRELYMEYNRALIAVPLYATVFCLHQVCAGTDNQLNLSRYYNANDTFMENSTNVEVLLEDLSNWQKLSVSKDLLAVLAWLFVSLGNKDDSFLMYLQSMEKYAQDVETSSQ